MESKPSLLQGPREDDSTIDVDELRVRLQKMTDAQLLQFGKAATYVLAQSQYGQAAARRVRD